MTLAEKSKRRKAAFLDSAFAVRIFEVLPRPFSRMSQNSTTASLCVMSPPPYAKKLETFRSETDALSQPPHPHNNNNLLLTYLSLSISSSLAYITFEIRQG